MLIHLLNEEHLNLVSCEVTLGGDANVIGIGPTVARASETFDLCDRFGIGIIRAPRSDKQRHYYVQNP
jgi:hypothetical protein